ncbi:MAG: hypothetical protein IIB10_12495 [Chloroflexi bacterium]|nr:hypothetical protein [Chloroflexota bacterium]
MAGLHVFAARRLIDAGRPREALRHFGKATRRSPQAVARVWYKGVQAMGGALGLAGLFATYRRIRRRLMHRRRKLHVNSTGIQWS